MDFNLKINCDNAAFEGENFGLELARILRRIAAGFSGESTERLGDKILDLNGNTVAGL
jgi:hypothetical protein